jgi:rSAM/selenodomain-associated transferase 1
MSEIPLILFAKAPIPGQVKTRLTPELTMEQAAEVAKVLLEETLKLTTRVWPSEVVLAVWPNLDDEFIQLMISRYKVGSIVQVDGDLGRKMFSAMEVSNYPCAVMGCDVPHCSEKILLEAYQRLSNKENIIGPTMDGGYYMLGLQESNLAIFENAQWGGEDVFNASMENACVEKIYFSKLEVLFDIDTYSDLRKASESLLILSPFLKS